MRKAFLFDLGGALVGYYMKDQFPKILVHAILEVGDYLQEVGLLGEPPTNLWDSVRMEDHDSLDHSVRPLEGRLARIFRLDESSLSESVLITVCDRFLQSIFHAGRLYDDTIRVLSELRERSYGTTVVSNTPWGSPAELWRRELAAIGLTKHLGATVFCRESDTGNQLDRSSSTHWRSLEYSPRTASS